MIYIKDKNGVYVIEREDFNKIVDADPDTFEVINDYFSKDKENIFVSNQAIPNLDLDSFEVVELSYYYGKLYVKDKNGVYVMENNNAKLIAEADPEAFQVINKNYNKDKNKVYYQDKILENADVNTFFALGDYSKDKNNVFYLNKIIPGVDMVNLQELGNAGSFRGSYAKDNLYVYCNGNILNGADPNTFEIINKISKDNKYEWDEYWDAKDENRYYLNCKA